MFGVVVKGILKVGSAAAPSVPLLSTSLPTWVKFGLNPIHLCNQVKQVNNMDPVAMFHGPLRVLWM